MMQLIGVLVLLLYVTSSYQQCNTPFIRDVIQGGNGELAFISSLVGTSELPLLNGSNSVELLHGSNPSNTPIFELNTSYYITAVDIQFGSTRTGGIGCNQGTLMVEEMQVILIDDGYPPTTPIQIGYTDSFNRINLLEVGNPNNNRIIRLTFNPIMGRFVKYNIPITDPATGLSCLRTEIYGCVSTTTTNSTLLQYNLIQPTQYADSLYTGVMSQGYLSGGEGLLNDGVIGTSPVTYSTQWLGWTNPSLENPEILLLFSYKVSISSISLFSSDELGTVSISSETGAVSESSQDTQPVGGVYRVVYSYNGLTTGLLKIDLTGSSSVLLTEIQVLGPGGESLSGNVLDTGVTTPAGTDPNIPSTSSTSVMTPPPPPPPPTTTTTTTTSPQLEPTTKDHVKSVLIPILILLLVGVVVTILIVISVVGWLKLRSKQSKSDPNIILHPPVPYACSLLQLTTQQSNTNNPTSDEYGMIINELHGALIEGEVADSKLYQELPCLKYQSVYYSEVAPLSNIGPTNPFIEPSCSLTELDSVFKSRIFEITAREIEFGEMFASGQFGVVYRGTYKTENGDIPVAVKQLKESADNDTLFSFMREAATMSQFSHPNVLRLLGVITAPQTWMVVTELLKTELRELLVKLRNSPNIEHMQWGLLMKFSVEIADGMEYLAMRKFVHRDLAARNVLVAKDSTVRIANFELSRRVGSENDYYTSSRGILPLRWTAPEAVLYQKYSEKSDVWSYGVTLYETWSLGERPWGDATNQEIIDALSLRKSISPPRGCPEVVGRVMMETWKHDKQDRPTFTQVREMLSTPSM